jgi:hypothetical protein
MIIDIILELSFYWLFKCFRKVSGFSPEIVINFKNLIFDMPKIKEIDWLNVAMGILLVVLIIWFIKMVIE